MRRKDREICDFNEIVNIISKCKVCNIAFNDELYPYIVPMSFGFEVKDNLITLFFHSASSGKKLDLISKNNKVAFVMESFSNITVDEGANTCKSSLDFESVMGTGSVEFLNGAQKKHALERIMAQYDLRMKPIYTFDEKVMQLTSVFKIEANYISAKKRQSKTQ